MTLINIRRLRFFQIIEVRVGPTATMPTNNSRDKTVLSCRRDVIGILPAHFFSPTAERFLQRPPAEQDESNEPGFVELELVGSNVRLRLGEHLRLSGWKLCHSDMSSSSCLTESRSGLMIEHSYRDRWCRGASSLPAARKSILYWPCCSFIPLLESNIYLLHQVAIAEIKVHHTHRCSCRQDWIARWQMYVCCYIGLVSLFLVSLSNLLASKPRESQPHNEVHPSTVRELESFNSDCLCNFQVTTFFL